jgi:hypothetical protein
MNSLLVLLNLALVAFISLTTIRTRSDFLFPTIILAGVIASFFLNENRLKGFTKKAVLSSLVFSILFGLSVALLVKDHYLAPQGMLVIFSFLAIPFNLFGLFVGMVILAVAERVEKIISFAKSRR